MDYELVDGFRIYTTDSGKYVVADGGGWLPGSWDTRDECLAGAHAYSRDFGYCSVDV